MKQDTSLLSWLNGSHGSSLRVVSTLLRVAFGGVFFMAGWSKFFDPEGWSAAGYLSHATGPFAGWFQGLAGSVVIDQLNIWGLLFIGAALILGICVRTASTFGFILMALYYLSGFEANTAHGFIDEHVIYALLFLVLWFGGLGNAIGLASKMDDWFPKRSVLIKQLIG